MTKQEIIDNNKLIADFCGWKYIPKSPGITSGYWKNDTPSRFKEGYIGSSKVPRYYLCRHHRELRYYNEWNWLMRAISQIEILGYRFQIGTKYVFVWYNGRQEYLCENFDGKLRASYHAIVEFIKWYNNKEYE